MILMRWLLKPFMRPIAKRELVKLCADQEMVEQAIARARKSKSRVSDFHAIAKQINCKRRRWEQWI